MSVAPPSQRSSAASPGSGESLNLDIKKILGGASGPKETEYTRYAKKAYGRASAYDKGGSERYRELLYGGYSHVEAAKVFKQFFQYLAPYKGWLALAAVGFLAASFFTSLRVLMVKFIIDKVLPGGAANIPLLIGICAALTGLFLLRCAVALLCQYIIVYIGGFVVFDVRKRLFDHLQLLHMGFYEKEMSGKLITRLIHDVTALQNLISTGLHVLVLALFTLIVNFAIMLCLSWKLTLAASCVIPAYWMVNQYYRFRLYRKSMEVRERNSVMAGNVTEVILGQRVVKSFAMENEERDRFNRMLTDNLGPAMELDVYNTHRNVLLNLLAGIGIAIVFLIGGLSILHGGPGAITLGTFVAFSHLLTMLYGNITAVANLKLTIIQAQTGLERVLAVMEIDPEIKEPELPVSLPDIQGRVEFRDVRFSYDDETYVIDGISLEAKPGEMVAFVGPSGSGKTTMMNLLTRFYDVKDGAILIDGYDLRRLSLKEYRSQIGIVLQDPFLFSGTIEDNIRYGRPGASMAEVIEAAKQANAWDFIQELPEKMDTMVGERGGLLSGGQRQRISIARALLKRPKILILDEATSSLDTESERLVQEAMDRLMAGRTVFVIAHRLSTVRNADKIVVMKSGKVEQIGRHEELLAQPGMYRRLYRGAKIQMVRKKKEEEEKANEQPVPSLFD